MRRGSRCMVVALAAWFWAGPAQAIFLDHERTLEVTGKVLQQASFRSATSDSGGIACFPFGIGKDGRCSGFTFPVTERGQLIQHRNLIDAEIYHDIGRWLGPDLPFFDKLGQRFRVKYFYEGLYDYGPKHYSEPSTAYKQVTQIPGVNQALGNILASGLRDNRHLNTQHDPIWNAYIEAAKGPVFVRVGRQDLSWGETDGFRLLDMIEPLDGRFGFPLVEDLDDRRIPLWMLRSTFNIGRVSNWLTNVSVDGYWVPGTIDNQEAPVAPPGNPFGLASPPGETSVQIPNKNLGNSRGGGRLIGTINDAVTFSIAHYVTFNDAPSARIYFRGANVGPNPFVPGTLLLTPDAAFLVEFYQQQITGGTATFALPFDPYTIIRMEMANFWGERVFIPNQPGGGGNLDPGPDGIGGMPTRNVLKWMIGADRNVWMRWLNPENTIFLSGQYFHTNILNYDKDLKIAAASSTLFSQVGSVGDTPLWGTSFNFVSRKNDEITLTYLINTLVYHGTITPQVFGAYDTRGVHALVPSISYQYGSNLVFGFKYAAIMGTYANLGLFRDRDMFLFNVRYNLS